MGSLVVGSPAICSVVVSSPDMCRQVVGSLVVGSPAMWTFCLCWININ